MKLIMLRTTVALIGISVGAISAQAAGQSALAGCYNKILAMCASPDELDPYEDCVSGGFDLCDNQHEKPRSQKLWRLDLEGLDRDKTRFIEGEMKKRFIKLRDTVERDSRSSSSGNRGGDESESGRGSRGGAS
ncbi:hypothetical protein [uncultured Cohaesibacter sp.]|uniref:hypothetical protein n=1 Tax=uncultured Cohaesibacter sp. TaxID=1002546 RepID=UPI0029C94C4A|nr:hypothetical protein [uncultured Cohaesibacter sp.]